MTISDSKGARPAAVTMPAADRAADTGRGIAFMLLAVGLFTCMDALVKWLGTDYPVLQIVFFRGLFAFIPLGIFLLRRGSLADLRTKRPFAHLGRTVVGLTALTSFFYAYTQMPLANVIAISFAAPLFVTALSVPLLGEAVGARRWTAVVVGFVGVLIMVRPDRGVLEPVALIAVLGTVCYALVMIFVRGLSRTETSGAIVFYYSIISTVLVGAVVPFIWVTPTWADLAVLAAVGLVGGMAQLAVTTAFRLADVAVIAPFDYSGMIWAALIGYLVWGDIPGSNVWVGVAIVAASGVYIVRREANLGLRRGVARPLQTKR